MRSPVASPRALPLRDLGTLVRVQYPDRPDLALIAALRLLASSGAAASGVRAAYARGAVLTRRTRNSLGGAHPASTSEPLDRTDGMLLIGENAPAVLIVDDGSLLDVVSSYRLGELDLPSRLLCGDTHPSPSRPDHTLADFPFGLTGVYLVHQVDSPLAAAYRLMLQLGPLTRRRLDFDLQHLEASWRQLLDTA